MREILEMLKELAGEERQKKECNCSTCRSLKFIKEEFLKDMRAKQGLVNKQNSINGHLYNEETLLVSNNLLNQAERFLKMAIDEYQKALFAIERCEQNIKK